VGGKRLLQVIFRGVEGKVPNKQFITHLTFRCSINCFRTVPDLRVSNHH
jgi:hypothetical protein